MEELFLKLLEIPNKSMIIKETFLIEVVELENYLDLIKLTLYKGNTEYKGIEMEKGLTFPIPKKDDIMLATKIYLKYNKLFQFQLYLEGNVINENKEIKKEQSQNIFSFEHKDIMDTLTKISKFKLENNCSTIFIVQFTFQKFAEVKSLSDLRQYSLECHYNINLKNKSFLWINFHQLQNNKVVTNKLTTVETINEEQLARILNIMSFNNLAIFKVIDINKNNIVVININHNIFNINKNNERIQ